MVPVFIVTLAVLGAGASPRALELAPRRDDSGVNWEAVRARTREYEAAKLRHRALHQPGLEALGNAEALVREARARSGVAPEGLERFSLPAAPTARELSDRNAAADQVEDLAANVAAHRMRALRYLQAVEERLASSAHQAELRERVRRQRQLVEERAREVDALAVEASAALREQDASFGSRLLGLSLKARKKDAASVLATLSERLRAWSGPGDTVLGAELTYVHGGATAAPMPEGDVTPAYLAGSTVLPTLEDTTQAREVELSQPIKDKAAQLGTAKAAYEFVKNQTRLEWYAGSVKGSTQTLRDLRGNDVDLSTLLIALLRAQGTPARYVLGTVELPLSQLAGAMGLLSASEADQLDAAASGGPAFTLPAATRERVLEILSASAVSYTPVESGGQPVAVRMARVWVEAFVPYSEYRGVGEGSAARQWVPLEPALSARARASATTPEVDVLAAWGEAPASLTAAYLQEAPTQSPLGAQSPRAFYRSRVEAYLAANHPGVGYEQVLRTVQGRAETLPLLPGSLPYKVVSVQREVAFLPESSQQRVRLVARDGAGELLSVELPLHRLTGHRSVLAYAPATAADEEVVMLAGGLYAAPASIVEVRPVVRVDGQEVARATRGVGLGTEHTWSLEVVLPGGTVRRIDNRIIAGNLVALGVGAPGNGAQDADAPGEGGDKDGPAVRFLYARAAAYANAWTEGEEELARLVRVLPVRPTANIVFVQNQLHVDAVLGVPQRLEWRGLEMDADFRAMRPVALVAGRGQALARLSGYEGSYQEARILAEGSGEDAVSSTLVLQLAPTQNIEVLLLTPENRAQELPKLVASAEVLRDVTDQLDLGRHVRIPASPVTVRDWTGTGFVAHDPATEEGGYFLSGRVSGGQTVVSPAHWADPALLDELRRPDAPPAVEEVEKVAALVKVRATDFQEVLAGKVAPLPLRVLALTAKGQAVKGAQVTFSRHGQAKAGLADRRDTLENLLGGTGEEVLTRIHALPDAVTVSTNEYGEALVYVVPDPSFAASGVFSAGSPEVQLLGLSEVMVRVPSQEGTLQVQEPFRTVVLPEVPAKLVARPALLVPTAAGLELGYPLGVRVQDKFGNLLANQSVTWSSSDSAGRFIDAQDVTTQRALRVKVLDPSDPTQVATLTQHTPMDGEVRVDAIPATPGSQSLVASVGAVSHSWTLPVLAPAPAGEEAYVFRVVTERGATFHGIYGMPLNSPVAGMVLRWSEGTWTALKGNEPGLELVKVRLVVQDEAGNVLLTQERSPFENAGLPGDDDETRVVFRPEYMVDDGAQLMTFTARVKKSGETSNVCCTESFYINPVSAKARLTVAQVKPTQEEVVLEGEPASTEDTKYVKLTVRHPSDLPVYVRVVQTPVEGAGKIIDVGGPDELERHPLDASLIKVPANITVARGPDGKFEFSSFFFSFPVVVGTVGGQVRFELLVQDVSQPSDLVPRRVVASKQVSVTAGPRLHLVDEEGVSLALASDTARYVVAARSPEDDVSPGFYIELRPKPPVADEVSLRIESRESWGTADFIEVTLNSENSYKAGPFRLINGSSAQYGNRSSHIPEYDEGDGGVVVAAAATLDDANAGAPGISPKDSDPKTLLVTSSSTVAVQQQSGTPVNSTVSIEPLTFKYIRSDGFPPRVTNPALLCRSDSQNSTFQVNGAKGFESQLNWQFDDVSHLPENLRHNAQFVGGNTGAQVQLSAPTKGHLVGLIVSLPGTELASNSAKLRVDIPVVSTLTVKVKPRVLATDKNDPRTYSIDPAKLPGDVATASAIWMQACIKFQIAASGVEVVEADELFVEGDYVESAGLRPGWPSKCEKMHTLCGITWALDQDPSRDYIEVYYRRRALNVIGKLGMTTPMGVVVYAGSNVDKNNPQTQAPELADHVRGQVLAHELGHHFRLTDNIDQEKINAMVLDPEYVGGHAQSSESLMYDSITSTVQGPYDISLGEYRFVYSRREVGFVSDMPLDIPDPKTP